MKLYRILISRRGSYTALLAALGHTCQSGAASILENLEERDHVSTTRNVRFVCLPCGLTREYLLTRNIFIVTEDVDLTLDKFRDNLNPDQITFLAPQLINQGYLGENSHKICIITGGSYEKSHKRDLGPVVRISGDAPPKRLLRHVEVYHDTFTWGDLHPSLQEEVVNEKIKFQNRWVTLGQLVSGEEDAVLQGQLLIDILKKRMWSMCTLSIPPSPVSTYIPRSLLVRSKIAVNVVRLPTARDVFLFTGLEWHKLTSLVKPEPTDNSCNQIATSGHITARFILLNDPGHFELIRQKTCAPVHWLHYDQQDGCFTWKRSHESLLTIQEFCLRNNPASISEERFVTHHLPSNMTSPVLISDTPGMGKSVLLASLGNRVLDTNPAQLVLFVQVTELITEFGKFIDNQNRLKVEQVEKWILAKSCSTEFGRAITSRLIHTSRWNLLLDAFDELNPSLHEFALRLITFIRNCYPTTLVVWLTTRPHLLSTLEIRLSVLGINIHPFTDQDQIKFLQDRWSTKVLRDEASQGRLRTFAMKILTDLNNRTSKNDRDIAGIPLQCLLLADGFQSSAMEFCTRGQLQIPPFTIGEMYGSFVRDKFMQGIWNPSTTLKPKRSILLYCTYKEAFAGDYLIKLCTNSHIIEAFKLLFPEWGKVFYDRLSNDMSKADMCKLGILEGTPPRFIHRTFAEYFVAYFVASMILSTAPLQEEFVDFLFTVVLATSPENVKLNVKPYQFSPHPVQSHIFQHLVIVHFLNGMLARDINLSRVRILSSSIPDRSERLREIFRACVRSDNFNVSQLTFYTALPHFNLLGGLHPLEILTLAATHTSFDFFKFLCEEINKSTPLVTLLRHAIYPHFLRFMTPLHAAVERGSFQITEYLIYCCNLEELIRQRHPNLLNCLPHVCVYESADEPVQVIHEKTQILKLLAELQDSDDMLREKDSLGQTVFTQPGLHLALLECLVGMRKGGVKAIAYFDEVR